MIGLVLIILIIFSAVWTFVWLWFFKHGKSPDKKLYKAASKALKRENYKKAIEVFEKIPDLDTNPEAKFKLGFAHLKLKEYDKAQACFEQILKTSPKNFDALFNLAQIFHFQKKYDEALEAYTKAFKENEKNSQCLLNIGKIYYEQEEYDKALEILEKAKEMSPEDADILFSIAKCRNELIDLSDENNYQEIINEFNQIMEKENLPPEFHVSFAKLYAKTGQIDMAFQHCKTAIEANEEDIEAYKLLGLIQLIKKDFSGAKNSLSIALNFEADNAETHNLFSYLLCSHEEGCRLEKCRRKYYELIKKQLQ